MLTRAEQLAAEQIAANATKSIPPAIDRAVARRALAINYGALLATAIGAMVVLGIGIGGGYLAGYRHGSRDATSAFTDLRTVLAEDVPAATAWRDLVAQNGRGIVAELKDCKPIADPSGRAACAVALWTTPAVPVAKGQQR